MKIDTAVILAGGKGSRLMPMTADKPKTLIPILDKPLMEWIILWLKQHEIKNIIVSVDHKKEILMKWLGDGSKWGVSVRYNDHTGAEETGDAFLTLANNKNITLPESFLVMNSDQITDLHIPDLLLHHTNHDPIATVVVCPAKIPYGIIEVGENHTAKQFLEKPVLSSVLMNTGIYVFSKQIARYLPARGALERTTFKKLAEEGKLKVYIHHGFFSTVNTHKDLQETEELLKRNNYHIS